MSDREPVNIMGVIAFPNPDHDKRMIRFIDSEYHTLFTIKDGESIVITRFDGEKFPERRKSAPRSAPMKSTKSLQSLM